MKLVLLVLLCSTLIYAIDDVKSTEKATEKPTETAADSSTKDENAKAETVRKFEKIVLSFDAFKNVR